jgi:hypothetical protein
MKHLLIALSLFATVVSKSSPTLNISPVVLASFQNAYENAKEILWSEERGLYKVTFTLENKYSTAYYDRDGNLLAMLYHIRTSDMPRKYQAGLKSKLQNSWITDLMEIHSENGISYYAIVENADEQIILKAVSSKKWEVFKAYDKQ